MKKFVLIFTALTAALRLLAQSNEPVSLALISESDEASIASDLLTAELSDNAKIHLLERDQIEKVYREQGMSAANRDDLKIGRLLGADGLLLLDIVKTPQTTNLTVRLIAVKPGVILTDGSFSWPMKDTTQWAGYLDSYLPKLTLLPKDVIPISVVNLRSAVQSDEALESERQLKLLTIQRLSQERQFFVLERQRMQLLREEKELKADDSAFWDGKYLLDGIIDQNGYSKETITINARLTPPKGGVPLLIEVSGSRTNLSEVINRLAEKVNGLMNVHSTVQEWDATDEAAQYYDEAKWALRWGVYSEAQAAADSAWALGKRDVDCAVVRVKAYVLQVTANVVEYEKAEDSYDCIGMYDSNDQPLGPPVSKSVVQAKIKQIVDEHPYGVRDKTIFVGSKNLWVIDYVSADKLPDPGNIKCALHALELYYEFSRNSPDGEPKMLWSGVGWNDWHNSEWYNLGIEDLIAASRVLQNFNLAPFELQKPVAGNLADLRAMARSVAEFISKSPSVHDSYFVGDRIAVYDELANTIGEDGGKNPSIFGCEASWGCFWQEEPEDEIALYQKLMSSPVFRYIHKKFWLRDLQTPRLTAWNDEDRNRIPIVWDNFIQELDNSTNVLLQLEGKAIRLADANDETEMATSFTNLFNAFFENHDALVANNVDVLYLDWGAGDLVENMEAGIASNVKDSLQHLYYSKYSTKLDAMEQEYRNNADILARAAQFFPTFEKQKEYLKANKPFDFMEFVNLFGSRDFSRAQALEIQPLIASYKSNLVAQSQNASGMQKGKLMGAMAQVGFLENDVNRILKPPTPIPRQQTQKQVTKSANVVIVPSVATNGISEIVTNVIAVNQFLQIPLDGLQGEQISDAEIVAHHWFEGKLLLDFNYGALVYTFDKNGNWTSTRGVTYPAIAILDPATEHWSVIGCAEVGMGDQTYFYHRSALLRGELFKCDARQIKKYDFINREWQTLPISDGNNYELFVVNGHLYGANGTIIFEIIDDGNGTRILASARRQPPESAPDTQDWGTPTLFEGPNHSLRVSASNKIYTWTGNDWHEDSGAPTASSQPEIFMDGVLFRQAGFLSAGYQNGVIMRQQNGSYGKLISQDEISSLADESNQVTLCLARKQPDLSGLSRPGNKPDPKPLWEMPVNLLPNAPAALRQSDLYLLEDSFAAHAIVNDRHEIFQDNLATNDEYNAALLCFSPEFPLPQKLFFKFNAPSAETPAWMLPATNLLFFGFDNVAPGGYGIGSGKAGVWLMPVSQIESAVAAQKQIQLAQMAQEKKQAAAALELAQERKQQKQKNLLAKYDRNHDGVIDSNEKEAALDDSDFIESQLDIIDVNHNGWLDSEELAYFDANKNKILDPKEQAGIEIVQHLLAERLLKKFDANGDGRLERSEFNNLLQSSFGVKVPAFPGVPILGIPYPGGFSFPDDNHDGYVDLAELESFLQDQTRRSLRLHGASLALLNQNGTGMTQPLNSRQRFKAVVEFYWQHHE